MKKFFKGYDMGNWESVKNILSEYESSLLAFGLAVKVEYAASDDGVGTSAFFSILSKDEVIFLKEYVVTEEGGEISADDFSEIEKIKEIAAAATDLDEDSSEAIKRYLQDEAKKAEEEVAMLEKSINKRSRITALICSLILGVTIIAAIVLGIVL